MRSYLNITRFYMSQNRNLDGTEIQRLKQTVYVHNIEDELYRVICALRFRGNKNLCYWWGVRKEYSWNRILQDTVNKFRRGKYDNLAIFRKHCYYR